MHSAIGPVQLVTSVIIFSVMKSPLLFSISSLILSVFHPQECSPVLVGAFFFFFWSIFTMAALKSLVDNSNMGVNLESVHCQQTALVLPKARSF